VAAKKAIKGLKKAKKLEAAKPLKERILPLNKRG
jgi:hypothetical protein